MDDAVQIIFDKFETSDTFASKLNAFRDCEQIVEFVRDKLHIKESEKDGNKSVAHRNNGNNLFQKKKDEEALMEYNEAVKFGLQEDQSLRLSFAFMDAVFVVLSGRIPEARKTLMAAELSTDKIPDEQKRGNFIETLQALEDLIRKTSSKDDMLVTGTRVAAENLPGFQADVKLPGFQVDVSLDSSQQSGRFVRAEQSIQVGQVICEERPVKSLKMDECRTRCNNCLLPTDPAPLWCSHCIQEELNKAVTEFLPLTTLNDNINVKGQKNNFASLLNLCGWEEQINLEKDFWTFVIILLYIELLEQKGYYSKMNINKEDTGHLLFRLFKILQHNSHSIVEAVNNPDCFKMETIGSGIYSQAAFLNHSCDPNTIKYFVGDRLVLVACRPIHPGEEITENYGPHFALSSKIARQLWTKEYHGFNCCCQACLSNYPMSELLTDEILHPVCPDRGGDQVHKGVGLRRDDDTWTCTCCQYRVKDSQLRSSLVAARKKLMTVIQVESCTNDRIKSRCEYEECINEIASVIQHPSALLLLAEKMYWRALRSTNGNQRKVN